MRPIYNIPLIYPSADHSSYRIGFKYRVISVRIETDSFTVGWSSWYCWKCGEETQSTHSSYWGVQGKGMWYFQWCEDDFTLWPKYFFNNLHFTSIFFLEKKICSCWTRKGKAKFLQTSRNSLVQKIKGHSLIQIHYTTLVNLCALYQPNLKETTVENQLIIISFKFFNK